MSLQHVIRSHFLNSPLRTSLTWQCIMLLTGTYSLMCLYKYLSIILENSTASLVCYTEWDISLPLAVNQWITYLPMLVWFGMSFAMHDIYVTLHNTYEPFRRPCPHRSFYIWYNVKIKSVPHDILTLGPLGYFYYHRPLGLTVPILYSQINKYGMYI